jgi:hypothetical protein
VNIEDGGPMIAQSTSKLLLLWPVALIAGLLVGAPTYAIDCHARHLEARRLGVHIPSADSGRRTIGEGTIPVYVAPNATCARKDVALRSGVAVDAYLEYAGFTLVLYVDPNNGQEIDGWVVTGRLKGTGTGIGPNQ